MKRNDTLVGQVLALNLLLVTATLLVLTLASGLDLSQTGERWNFLLLSMTIILTLLVNMLLLKRRFSPLERLIERLEAIDPAGPVHLEPPDERFQEVARLTDTFRRLLARIEAERQRSGRLVLRAQEQERRRVARDLHDEVNQALTAILLRLEALSQDATPEHAAQLSEVKRLTNQAMQELLDLARQLRPSALDDLGLVPAIAGQLRQFESQTGLKATLMTRDGEPNLTDEQQTAVYRVVQEALSNVAQHADARRVDVELVTRGDATELRVRDDGCGFDPSAARNGGLGLNGMAERARLVGAQLDIRSASGGGTSIVFRIP
jgi:two-component system, NarL family, sensor histidine kinase UhpB